jgi:hypothetical protein
MDRVIATDSSLTLRVINNTEIGIVERLKVSFRSLSLSLLFYCFHIGSSNMGNERTKIESWQHVMGLANFVDSSRCRNGDVTKMVPGKDQENRVTEMWTRSLSRWTVQKFRGKKRKKERKRETSSSTFPFCFSSSLSQRVRFWIWRTIESAKFAVSV